MLDVLVVGGGLTGGALVAALTGADTGLSVGLIDPTPQHDDAHPSYDDRAIAVAAGSMRILCGIGVGANLVEQSSPILQVHVSDRGQFGFTRLCSDNYGLPALGYVIDARSLGRILDDALHERAALAMFAYTEVVAVEVETDRVCVTVRDLRNQTEQTLLTRLLVAADGGHSRVRDLLGVAALEHDYQQCAITANVTMQRAHQHTAYERFTDWGPMALLPMTEGRCGVVWTLPSEHAASIAALDDAGFAASFGERFGHRLGAVVQVGERSVYPLRLIRAQTQVLQRVVVVGNAAHTLHPVAGQGLNLALRDIAALAEVLVCSWREGIDVGDSSHLAQYHDWRHGDQQSVTRFTDGLARWFASDLAPIRLGRSLGMVLLDFVPPLKRHFVSRAAGLHGRQSRLARGLPL